MTTSKTGPRVSDEAVKAKTGKVWKEWFSILDRAGAKKMTHQEIAMCLRTDYKIGPWWTQVVTVTYEQDRGLRDKHQRPDGYQISVSRTIDAPITKIFKSFANENDRTAWLGEEGLVVRKSTTNKSIRVTWNDKKTNLQIGFSPKGEKKGQVVVQHSRLPNDKAAAKMKTFWAKALDRLKASLEK